MDLPNCLGSLTGKHIRIKTSAKSGSVYFNCKGNSSIILVAVSGADGLFLSMDIGEYDRNSDGKVLKESSFARSYATPDAVILVSLSVGISTRQIYHILTDLI